MKRALTGLAAAALLMGLAAGCDSPSDPTAGAESTTALKASGLGDFEFDLVALVNQHRVSKGLHALITSVDLSDVARDHSEDMITRRYFDHSSPEGWTAGDRLSAEGIAWTAAGENIGAGYDTPEAVFSAWMASPGHRAAIENRRWTETGVGYRVDAAPTETDPHVHYWTQVFMQP